MLHIRALVTAMPKAYMEHRKDHAYFKQKLSAVTEQGKQSSGKDFTTPAEARVSHFPSLPLGAPGPVPQMPNRG